MTRECMSKQHTRFYSACVKEMGLSLICVHKKSEFDLEALNIQKLSHMHRAGNEGSPPPPYYWFT